MAKADSFSYNLGEKIELKKLKGKVKGELIGNIYEIKEESIVMHVYPSGRIRVFSPEKEYPELKEIMFSESVTLSATVQEIISATGSKADLKKVIKEGKQDRMSDYDNTAQEKKTELVSSQLLRQITIAAYEVSGDFQVERIMTQAGETEGRKLAEKAESKKELVKEIINYLDREGIGKAEEIEAKGRKLVDTVLRVEGCLFAAGFPNINKKICNFTRGVIRGAFAEFKGAETVSVKEVHCWAQGDAYCEFEVYSLSA